jgi:mannose-6-phosphate isomerase-like protein (cupin superfamily)
MIKPIFYLALPFIAINLKSQPNYFIGLDTIKAPKNLENTSIIPLFHDTINVSSFLIFINKEVKLHKHITHDEQVYVMEGEGQMQLGEKIKEIKKGDFIFIPKNTFHSVKTTSNNELKVISIQAPYFDGKDRFFKKPDND